VVGQPTVGNSTRQYASGLCRDIFIYIIKIKRLILSSKAVKGPSNFAIVFNKALVEVIEA